MNSAQYVGAVSAMHGVGLAAFSVFLTILSGYMVVAYSIGRELKTTQLVIINIIFLSTATMLAYGTYAYFNSAFHFQLEYNATGRLNPNEGYVPGIFLAIQLISVAGAIKFMTDVRKASDAVVKQD